MARYDIATSHVVYSPSNLSLNTDDHRASLDGNQVAELSGVDPKRSGSLKRAVGGRHIKTLGATPETVIPYQFTGKYAAEMLETVTTANVATDNATTSYAFPVDSTAGFRVGECVAIFKEGSANQECWVGKITAIESATSMTVSRGAGTFAGAATGMSQIPSGSRVVRTCITGSMDNGSTQPWSAVTVTSIFRLAVGMTVLPIRCGPLNGTRVSGDTLDTRTITGITASGTTFTVTLSSDPNWGTVNPTSDFAVAVALIPIKSSFNQSGILYSTSTGVVRALHQGTDTEILNDANSFGSSVRSSSLVGNAIFSFSPASHPVRVVPCSLLSSGQHCHIGWPDLNADHNSPVNYASVVGGGTGFATGTYRMFIRALDESVYPVSKSPPLVEFETTTGESDEIDINFSTVLTAWYSAGEAAFYSRATSFEIWCTATNLTTPYFLIARRHLSFAQSNLGVWDTAITMGTGAMEIVINSNYLIMQEALDDADFMKYEPPMAGKCYYGLGVVFCWGQTTATTLSHWTPVLMDNLLLFSRVDAEEPENFPPENYKVIGQTGDKIQGMTTAGSYAIALSQNTYTLISRAGTYLMFDEYDQLGHGCPHEYGFCSMGPAAAWVGDENVWVVQPDVSTDPVDIGQPIADWIRSLLTEPYGTQVVRMGYDAVEQSLWVSNYNSTTHDYEARVFHLPTKTWAKREAIKIDALVMARGISSGATPWSFYYAAGTNLFQSVDRVLEPKMAGGWDETTLSEEVDCSAFRGTNSNAYYDSQLPAAADSSSGVLDLGQEVLVAGAYVGCYLKLTKPGTPDVTHYYYITANTTQVLTLDTDETPDSTTGNLYTLAKQFIDPAGYLFPVRLSPALTTEIDAAGELVGSIMTFLDAAGTTIQATRPITAASYESHTCEAVGGVTRKIILLTVDTDSYDPMTSYTDRWIISGIPFRLRFPPIRGEDPFVEKSIIGAQILVDGVDLPAGQETNGITMTVAAFRNFSSTPAHTGSFTITEAGVTQQDSNFSTALRASGKVLEVELQQLDNWGNFEVLYAGVPVKSLGVFSDDRSATV